MQDNGPFNVIQTYVQLFIKDKKIMRHAFTLMFALVAFSGMAQTEEQSAPDEKWKWSVGGLFTLMAPYGDHHYYDKDKERYVPQTSMVWMGVMNQQDRLCLPILSHLKNLIW